MEKLKEFIEEPMKKIDITEMEIMDENKSLAIYLMEHNDESVWENIQEWSGLSFILSK